MRPDGVSVTVFRAVYGFGYFALGAAMLGAVARLRSQAGMPTWRLVMLTSGSALALAEGWIVHMVQAAPMRLENWMAAVLGLVVAAMVPRLLPFAALRYWLAAERRAAGG